MITWLQSVLLECCFVKLNMNDMPAFSPPMATSSNFQDDLLESEDMTRTLTTTSTATEATSSTITTTTIITTNNSVTTTSTTTTTSRVSTATVTSSEQYKKVMEPVPHHCISKLFYMQSFFHTHSVSSGKYY